MKGPKPWGGHVLFAVIAGLMAIAVFVGFWWERSVERRLQAHGLTVMGSVEVRDVRPGSSRDKPNQYYLEVDFSAKGQMIRRRFPVSQYTFDSYRFHSPIAVVYDPAKPTVNRLRDEIENGSSWGLLLFGIALLAASVGVGVWAYRMAHEPPEPPDLDEALAKARRS